MAAEQLNAEFFIFLETSLRFHPNYLKTSSSLQLKVTWNFKNCMTRKKGGSEINNNE